MKSDDELFRLARDTADDFANDVLDTSFKDTFECLTEGEDPELTIEEYNRLVEVTTPYRATVFMSRDRYDPDWDDDNIWPTCQEWCRIHGIDEKLFAGILEFHGEAAWYPPNDQDVTQEAIFQFCVMNYANYRLHNPESEDIHLYGMNPCNCEHRDHFEPDEWHLARGENWVKTKHDHMSVPAGDHVGMYVGAICDDCAATCMKEYLIS